MKSLLFILLVSISFGSYAACIQTMNAYGVWKKSDIFRSELKKQNKRLLNGIKKLDTCEIYLFQEVWTSTTEGVLKGLSSVGAKFKKIPNPNEKEFNIGLAFATANIKINNSDGKTFHRNAPGKDGDMRNLPFVKVKKGFNKLELTNRTGESFTVINTHLQPMGGSASYNEIKATQLSHALDIVDYVFNSVKIDQPLFVVGDFNNSVGSLTFKILNDVLLLKDSFLEVNSNYGGICTYCGQYKSQMNSSVIDYILFKNSTSKKVTIQKSEINLRSSRSNFMSDHSGVRSKFEISSANNISQEVTEKRIQKAVKVLNEVKAFFVKVGSFEREVKKTSAIIQKIESNDLREYFSIID